MKKREIEGTRVMKTKVSKEKKGKLGKQYKRQEAIYHYYIILYSRNERRRDKSRDEQKNRGMNSKILKQQVRR